MYHTEIRGIMVMGHDDVRRLVRLKEKKGNRGGHHVAI